MSIRILFNYMRNIVYMEHQISTTTPLGGCLPRAARGGPHWTTRRTTGKKYTSTTDRSVISRGFLDQAWGISSNIASEETLRTLSETLPQNLFACSIIPYIGFLYHLTKAKDTPKLTLFGFYFLLVFVFATIPAGIYAKKVYGTTLANVDYLHGSAEFMLTLTNLFIVLGLRQAIRAKTQQNNNNN